METHTNLKQLTTTFVFFSVPMPRGTRVFGRFGVTHCLHLQCDNLIQANAAIRAVTELDIRQSTFHNNRYSPNEIQPVLYPTHQTRQPRDNKMTTGYLPFIQNSFKSIGRVLSKHNIKTVGLPPHLQAYIASLACATKCTLDKQVVNQEQD